MTDASFPVCVVSWERPSFHAKLSPTYGSGHRHRWPTAQVPRNQPVSDCCCAQPGSRRAPTRIRNHSRELLETFLQIHSHQVASNQRGCEGFNPGFFCERVREKPFCRLRCGEGQFSDISPDLFGWIHCEPEKS